MVLRDSHYLSLDKTVLFSRSNFKHMTNADFTYAWIPDGGSTQFPKSIEITYNQTLNFTPNYFAFSLRQNVGSDVDRNRSIYIYDESTSSSIGFVVTSAGYNSLALTYQNATGCRLKTGSSWYSSLPTINVTAGLVE